MSDSIYLIVAVAVAAVVVLFWLFSRRARPAPDTQIPDDDDDRLDTLIGWPPQATRILRTSERLAYSTLKLALPGYIVLAQVPVARFIDVPKRNSYAEWMRRLGGQCVDFVVCDVTSQVVAVIDVRPPDPQLSSRVKRRTDRLARVLQAVNIPMHVWNEEALPSVETARASILPNAPRVPPAVAARNSAVAEVLAQQIRRRGFEDTDREFDAVEVTELPEPSSSTWFDELDSESSKLPPREARKAR